MIKDVSFSAAWRSLCEVQSLHTEVISNKVLSPAVNLKLLCFLIGSCSAPSFQLTFTAP